MTDDEAESAAQRADELALEVVRLIKQADGQFGHGMANAFRREKAFQRFSFAVSRMREAVRRRPRYVAKPTTSAVNAIKEQTL
jgi:hypothetical protein